MLQRDEWLSQYFPSGSAYRYIKPFNESAFPDGFIYAKVQTNELNVFNTLITQGFQLADVLLNFIQQKNVDQSFDDSYKCRFACATDKEQIAKIAKDVFTHSRFHRDLNMSHNLANKIKEDWACNYFLGKRGTQMIVVESNATVCGFMLMIDQVIDLIGTDPKFLRKGIATKMIAFANAQIGLLKAGTQSSNSASIKLYQKAGFTLDRVQLVLHKHVG
jgi:ribosomal protein S18 acetylase RimI-like enzyme